MTHALKVAGGDRLGKTIIFAKNCEHTHYIAERFDSNYPHLGGSLARVIEHKTEYGQTLIDDFSQAEKAPTSLPQWTCFGGRMTVSLLYPMHGSLQNAFSLLTQSTASALRWGIRLVTF